MSTATLILMIIGTIIGLIVIAGLVMSKEMRIEKSVTINKPKQHVFDYVKMVKNQDNFSVWNMKDPSMKKEYRGTDGQVGFVYTWDSTSDKNVGAGEQEIKLLKKARALILKCALNVQWKTHRMGKWAQNLSHLTKQKLLGLSMVE